MVHTKRKPLSLWLSITIWNSFMTKFTAYTKIISQSRPKKVDFFELRILFTIYVLKIAWICLKISFDSIMSRLRKLKNCKMNMILWWNLPKEIIISQKKKKFLKIQQFSSKIGKFSSENPKIWRKLRFWIWIYRWDRFIYSVILGKLGGVYIDLWWRMSDWLVKLSLTLP